MKGRVLVVEDELIVADDLQWQLSQIGYEVVGIAASGEEALAMAGEQLPDIVLMDIKLQGNMNGIEAAKLIQEKTGVAIVFVTAFAAVFLRNPIQIQAPGICLSKPFSPLHLKTALETAMKKPSVQ